MRDRLRFRILRRDGFRCVYCGRPSTETKLEIDHVVPRSVGGSDDPSNLASACRDCNAGKSADDPRAPCPLFGTESARDMRVDAAEPRATEKRSGKRLDKPKGDLPPEELRLRVKTQLLRLGPNQVAKILGLDRKTVLGVGAGCHSLPGTLALIRERLPLLEQRGGTCDS